MNIEELFKESNYIQYLIYTNPNVLKNIEDVLVPYTIQDINYLLDVFKRRVFFYNNFYKYLNMALYLQMDNVINYLFEVLDEFKESDKLKEKIIQVSSDFKGIINFKYDGQIVEKSINQGLKLKVLYIDDSYNPDIINKISVQELILDNLNIDNLNVLAPNLKKLTLVNTSICCNGISNCVNLKSLIIYNNHNYINCNNLINLEELYLFNEDFYSVSNDDVKECKNIKILSVSEDSITDFSMFPKLENLDISRTGLTNDCISGLTLKEFSCNENIKYITPFEKNLRVLKIKSTIDINNCENLEFLQIENSNIKDLNNLTNLRTLIIGKDTKLDNGSLLNCKKIHTLKILDYCNITNFNPFCKTLSKLVINKFIPELNLDNDWFKKCSNIVELYLYGYVYIDSLKNFSRTLRYCKLNGKINSSILKDCKYLIKR